MRKIIPLFLVLLLSLTGCGKDSSSTSSGEESTAGKTLIVGTTNASPPSGFVNGQTNEVDGIMVDIAKEVSKRAGINIKFEAMSFASLIPSLEKGRIDLIAAGASYNEERAKVVQFSDFVYGFHEALVVPSGNKQNLHSLEDLKGKRVGVGAGTIYERLLKDTGVSMEIKVYEKTDQILLDLSQGRIDAMINDAPVVDYLIKQNSQYKVEIVNEYEPQISLKMGIIMSLKNTELQSKLNKAIQEMKDDGTLEEIHKKWGIKMQEFIDEKVDK